jgi:hypothetical protein
LLTLIASSVLAASGCGYLKNVRDDGLDCVILGVGYTPPVAPGDPDNRAVGFLPPSIGLYLEATEFLHLGGIYKASGDLEWDRRALGAVVDVRGKAGIGPLHYQMVRQSVGCGNAYKTEGNQMDGWREHMRNLRDPIFQRPAKELVFRSHYGLPFLHRGWQDWEVIGFELAIPEPFILHSGFNVRAGVDPSQVVDFVLGFLCIDYYDDNAFRLGGELQHTQ